MARILVVEDDPDIAGLIAHCLATAGHASDLVPGGADVLPRVRAAPPDLIVLDLMLPGLDGLAVCRILRADPLTAAIPIIMVTARAHESDRIVGLELGADDYVTKPFSPRELVARVGALLRRTSTGATLERVFRYGPLVLDPGRHRVTLEGREVSLTAKEFLLLQYLLGRPGRLLSRDLLLTDVWGYQHTGATRTVDVHIRRLREKLPFLSEAIVTVQQFGYKLKSEWDP
jgi:two-component system, OmpR family, alkaline phosphatase synthesis response regulator PhoP